MALEGNLDVAVTDDAVEFSVTITNTGTEAIDLEFRSGQDVDVAVEAAGEERWRWSDGRMVTQAIRTKTLAPGEAVTHDVTWTDPEPGEYTATASLAATTVTLEERREFTVS